MKKTNRWIRPLNWHAPQKPVVRRVSDADLPSEPLSNQPVPADTILFEMTNDNWIQVLKCLHLYSQKDTTPEWRAWRLQIREKILRVVNANTNQKSPVAVPLSKTEWHDLLRYTGEVCDERGDEWRKWYNKLKNQVGNLR